jgi:hypothetical protein
MRVMDIALENGQSLEADGKLNAWRSPRNSYPLCPTAFAFIAYYSNDGHLLFTTTSTHHSFN